jgi:DNA polymerase-4
VPAGAEAGLLGPLPVRKFPGIGPVAEQKLARLGLTTLASVAAAPLAELRRIFGAWAESIQRGCRGFGAHELGRERPAFQEHDPVGSSVGTISNERTFREDVRDPTSIESMLCSLCERVCWRARKRGIKARTVTLKLRYADFQTLSRSRTITPTASELELYPVVNSLFLRARRRRTAIRLLGIALSNLGYYDEQLPLFVGRPARRAAAAHTTGDEALHRAVDGIRKRYGYDALRIALTVSRGSR